MLASVVSQPGVHTVDAILHRWIGAGHPEGDIKPIAVAAEEVFDDLPIGARVNIDPLPGFGLYATRASTITRKMAWTCSRSLASSRHRVSTNNRRAPAKFSVFGKPPSAR